MKKTSLWNAAVVVSALGYFVDVYDLILFSVVRRASLTDLGVPQAQLLDTGVSLLNSQMLGMLLGGVAWGLLGDRFGRLKVLFGSIILYSLANIANGLVTTVGQYGLLRFVAGFGLAGELGAGITLVAELLPKESRGLGTTIVASVGIAGAVVAGVTGELLPWRLSYVVGGLMGLGLLVIRISVHESQLFEGVRGSDVSRGSIKLLFGSGDRVLRYVCCVLLGLPIWYTVGILVTLSPEITAAMGAPVAPSTGLAVSWCYVGLFLGDIAGGLLSQALRSRKRSLGIFIAGSFVAPVIFLSQSSPSVEILYLWFVVLGFFAGYWVLVVTVAAEQFGTNVRATATTTVPNFIRGAVVPMTSCFVMMKEPLGVLMAAKTVGLIVAGLAVASLFAMKETFHSELDFVET